MTNICTEENIISTQLSIKQLIKQYFIEDMLMRKWRNFISNAREVRLIRINPSM